MGRSCGTDRWLRFIEHIPQQPVLFGQLVAPGRQHVIARGLAAALEVGAQSNHRDVGIEDSGLGRLQTARKADRSGQLTAVPVELIVEVAGAGRAHQRSAVFLSRLFSWLHSDIYARI